MPWVIDSLERIYQNHDSKVPITILLTPGAHFSIVNKGIFYRPGLDRARARPDFRGHEIAEKRGEIRGRGRRAVIARGQNSLAARPKYRPRADMILTARGRAAAK